MMKRGSWIIAGALALFMTLAGTGTSYALWSSQATANATVAAGSVGATLSGAESLAVSYSATQLQQTGTLVITNTGSVATTYSAATTLASGSSAPMASQVAVTAWKAADCTAPAPSGATTGSWQALPPLTGSLAAGASATWCVHSSLTEAQVQALSTASVTPAITLTAATGSWTARASASAVQAVTKTAASLQCANSDPYNAVVTWANVPGATWLTRYGVWVNGIQVSSGQNSGYTSVSLGSSTVTAAIAPTGTTAKVEARQILDDGSTVTIATGAIIIGVDWGNRTVQCG